MREKITSFVATQYKLQGALWTISAAITLLLPVLFIFSSSLSDAVLSTVAVLFLAHSWRTRNFAWAKQPWILCLWTLWVYMTLRGAFAEHPAESLRRGVPFLRYFVFAAALAHWIMRVEQYRALFMRVLTGALLFIMADSFWQWLSRWDILGYEIVQDAQRHFRLTGPFGKTKVIVGIMLVWLSFPAAVAGLTADGRFRRGKKLLAGLAFALSVLVMIALSGERMALLLCLLGWGITLLLLRLNLRWMVGSALAGAALLGIMAFTIPSFFERQVGATYETFAHWKESPYGKIMVSDMALAVQNPIIGIGANHFRTACPKLYPGQSTEYIQSVCNLHPHNIYFEWLIENGIIGFGLFLGFLGCVATACYRQRALLRVEPFFLGWCVAFILRVWPVGSSTGFFSNWGAPPFWLVLGMVLVYALPASRTERL